MGSAQEANAKSGCFGLSELAVSVVRNETSIPNPAKPCAASALRASEILAVRWSDVLWNEGRIRISKRWAKGKDGETKTEASEGYVPLHPILAAHLRAWRGLSPMRRTGTSCSLP